MTLADLQSFYRLHPGFAAVTAAAFGACVGSFLNVCIHRLPKGESIVTPASRCACGQPIPFWFNLPLLGWLILRGRARCCGGKISVRYPLVELITALSFVAAWTMLPPGKALAACVFLPLLIILAGCDLDDMMVPDAPNFALVGAGLLLSMLLPSLHGETAHSIEAVNRFRALMDALIGVAAGTALVWWIRTIGTLMAGREAMGEADIILCAGVGAFGGWQGAVFCLFGGAVAPGRFGSFAGLNSYWPGKTGRFRESF
jgi:leader peptidase (prepilin peptidase)/N-methyltransferase